MISYFIAALCYVSCLTMLYRRWQIQHIFASHHDEQNHGDLSKRSKSEWLANPLLPWILLTVACLCHGINLSDKFWVDSHLNIALGRWFSFFTLFTAFVSLSLGLFNDLRRLTLVILPLALLGLSIGHWTPGALYAAKSGTILHLSLSILAFTALTLCLAQAMLIIIQEQQLKRMHTANARLDLPALDSMEQWLTIFLITGIGLLLLSLLTGMFSLHKLTGQWLEISHHVILSVICLTTFSGVLLFKIIYGWRGGRVAHWVLGGFVVLILSYFGTRFVIDVILR